MRHHATLTAHLPSLSLASVFQAAAGRAWARTRPTRAYHRTSLRTEGASSTVHRSPGGHDVGGAMDGPSSSHTRLSYTSVSPPDALPPVQPSRRALAPHPSPHSSDNAPSDMGDNRGRTSTPSRPPTRRGVTFVDVETLSPHDFEHPRFVSPGSPAYDSDPPWEEIRASVPAHLLPRAVPFKPQELPPLPHPSTQQELVQNLVDAITAEPPTSLSQALSYHAAHAALHSTASFNLLIRYAIRCASFRTVDHLLRRMVHDQIPGDQDTRVLRVRSMVRSGQWSTAWTEETARMKAEGLGMPLPVWLEFFGSVKRGAIMSRASRDNRRTKEGRAEFLQTPDPTVTAARFHALMEHRPLVTADEWQLVPPHAVHALVRALLAQDRRTAAVEMTRSYFESLPRELDESWRHSCLAIIHLHMDSGRARNLSAHFSALQTLFAFLDMHRCFQPTSSTLFRLLRTLKSTQRCGERADKLIYSFERRWGPDILDDRVRRRWASLWLKQERPDRAERILAVQSALDMERTEWRAELAVTGAQSGKGRRRRLRWLDLSRAPRKGKERWHWRLLRRRIWRAQVRRSKELRSHR
ncbi:hypothetical protein OH76DRAFT_1348960 [Lentinus brumalis]|uniref:ATPase expression protein 2, mitochondrial n=1 Tax=Lentinus brumalis TaxID=2498619 RepID=A0A371DD43_9APHY|nr:hypothetical protein OH76DRAFT_1348960 [Polyporus brumalis]